MWVVEVNVAKWRFYLHLFGHRPGVSSHGFGWRPAPQRPPTAA